MSGVVYCGCGHTLDDHPAGGPCKHINHSRQYPIRARCGCQRLHPDARLTDSDDFVAKALNNARAKHGWEMEPVEVADARQVLAIVLWKAAQAYDSRSHIRFRVYAYTQLLNRAIDHVRAERGRNGEKRVYDPRAGLADLDAGAGVGDGAAGADRLDSLPSRDPADDPDGWASDGAGLLAAGDGGGAGLAGEPGKRRRRRDSGGDLGAVLPDDRRPRAEDRGAGEQAPEDLRGAA